MIQCHKCVTELLYVTDQPHTQPLGLQVPTHRQLVNNRIGRQLWKCPTMEKSTEGAWGIAPLLHITWQYGSTALKKTKDTSRERYLPTENNLLWGHTCSFSD